MHDHTVLYLDVRSIGTMYTFALQPMTCALLVVIDLGAGHRVSLEYVAGGSDFSTPRGRSLVEAVQLLGLGVVLVDTATTCDMPLKLLSRATKSVTWFQSLGFAYDDPAVMVDRALQMTVQGGAPLREALRATASCAEVERFWPAKLGFGRRRLLRKMNVAMSWSRNQESTLRSS